MTSPRRPQNFKHLCIQKKSGFSKNDLFESDHLFWNVTVDGLLRMCEDFGITLEDFIENATICELLERGQLDLVKCIHGKFGLEKPDIMWEAEEDGFHTSCENGHLENVKWIHETFGIERKHVIGEDFNAFHMAVRNDHFGVARYLKDILGLEFWDLDLLGEHPFYHALEIEDLGTMDEICDMFNVTKTAILKDLDALDMGIEYALESIVRWLHVRFGLTAQNIRNSMYFESYGLRIACATGDRHLVAELFSGEAADKNAEVIQKATRIYA